MCQGFLGMVKLSQVPDNRKCHRARVGHRRRSKRAHAMRLHTLLFMAVIGRRSQSTYHPCLIAFVIIHINAITHAVHNCRFRNPILCVQRRMISQGFRPQHLDAHVSTPRDDHVIIRRVGLQVFDRNVMLIGSVVNLSLMSGSHRGSV
jgi:hypothetical protein